MIISFYSFKGGVGRTMALVNVGVELASAGKRVLLVDLDLEAPGLTSYMRDLSPTALVDAPGMIDWLTETVRQGVAPAWRSYVSTVEASSDLRVDVLTSGQWNDGYNARVLDFNWAEFFQRGGGDTLEILRADWNKAYDFVLVDSRTGITDTAGVCTVHLPDVIVPVFTANEQSVNGVRDVIGRAQQARMKLANPRGKALVFPLASRFDDRTESNLSREWMSRFADRLGHFYDEWLPTSLTPRQALERTKLPYVSFYSFGDNLAVLRDSQSDVTSLGFAFRTAARLVEQNFRDADRLLAIGSRLVEDDDPVLRFETLLRDNEEESGDLVAVMSRVLYYAAQPSGPAGPPAEAIEGELLRLLLDAGVVERAGDRVAAISAQEWLQRSNANLDDYRREHEDVIAWSYRVVEAVAAELDYMLTGSDLAQGLEYTIEPGAMTRYEYGLVESSQQWARGQDRVSSGGAAVILRSYAVVGLGALVGLLVGWLLGSALQTAYGSFYSLAGGAIGGLFGAYAAAVWVIAPRSRTRPREVELHLSNGSSTALRTAALALQEYGYEARRSSRVVILTLRDTHGLPVGVRGVPLISPVLAPHTLSVQVRLARGDVLEIEGPRFAVERVASALESTDRWGPWPRR